MYLLVAVTSQAAILTEVYMMTESTEESYQCIHFGIVDNIIEKLNNHGNAKLNIWKWLNIDYAHSIDQASKY